MLYVLYFNRGRLHVLMRLISSLRCPLRVQVQVLCSTVKHFNIRFSQTFLCSPCLVYSDSKTIKISSQTVALYGLASGFVCTVIIRPSHKPGLFRDASGSGCDRNASPIKCNAVQIFHQQMAHSSV